MLLPCKFDQILILFNPLLQLLLFLLCSLNSLISDLQGANSALVQARRGRQRR